MKTTNSILGLAVLGIGGFLLYTTMKKKGVGEEAAILSTPLTPAEASIHYTGAIQNWEERLEGELLPNGDKIFEPLDVSPTNPLRLYYAIVKKGPWRPQGTQKYPPPTWEAPPAEVGEIFLFNTVTNREVSLVELAKSEMMTPDAQKATEETFANAFVYSCEIWPFYFPWTNGWEQRNNRNVAHWRGLCRDKFNTGL